MSTETKEENVKQDNISERTFILDGNVNEASVRKIVESIIKVNHEDATKYHSIEPKSRPPIKIIVNTFGGALYDANLLVATIENSLTPVHTYNHSKAMSAGFLIYLSGHKRFATPMACFMYHDGTVGLHDSVEGLKVSLEHQVNLIKNMDSYILSRTKLPKEMMKTVKRLKECLYLFADDALTYGIVDEIIPYRNDYKR
jgi:ATP-dependent Clp protease, protease subunit